MKDSDIQKGYYLAQAMKRFTRIEEIAMDIPPFDGQPVMELDPTEYEFALRAYDEGHMVIIRLGAGRYGAAASPKLWATKYGGTA